MRIPPIPTLCFTNLLLGCLPAFAQTSGPARGIAARTPDYDRASVTRNCGLQLERDGRLIGIAHGYHAEFGPQSLSYTPALGTAAPHDLPLQFEFTAVGRGENLSAPSPAKRQHDGLTVAYQRGSVTETYEVRRDGVKQSFVFRELPKGEGDLIVRGRVSSELIAGPVTAEGTAYTLPGIGGVTIGAVLGFDAAGHEVRGELRRTADGLEFRLPATFVDRAVLPLVLDPTLGTQVVLGGAGDDEAPDLAWDASSATWLVVWQRTLSATNSDILAQRLDGAGALLGTTLSVESNSATLAVRPRVANINGANEFIVAYSYGGDVFARGVAATTGLVVSLTAEVALATGSNNQTDVDIGGEALDFVGGAAYAVWSDLTTTSIHARSITYVTGGALSLGPTLTVVTGANDGAPSISQSGGQTGNWLICWFRLGSPLTAIRGRLLGRSDVFVTATTLINVGVATQQPAVDGDGRNWVVASSVGDLGGVDRDIYVQSISLTQANSLALGSSVAIDGNVGVDESTPAVAWLGNSAIVTYQERQSNGQYNTYAVSIDPFTCLGCEGAVGLGVTGDGETAVQIGTQFSGGGFGNRNAAIVWQSVPAATGVGDVLFQTYRARHGSYTDLGGGCGVGGTSRASCAVNPNAQFHVRLRGGPASATTWGVIGFERIDHRCGPCTLVADPFRGLVWSQTTDVNGNAGLNLPILAGSGGSQFYLQWLTIGSTCSLGFETSNALQIGIENF